MMEMDELGDSLSESLPEFDEAVSLITLTHSPPIWTLPASSPLCLEAMLFLRMCKIPFSKKASNYHTSSKGELPHLHQYRYSHGADSYMEFVKQTDGGKYNIDSHLDSNQLVFMNALSTHIRHKLSLITAYMMWVDADNQKQAFRAFGATLPLVLRRIFLNRRLSDVVKKCHQNGLTTKSEVKEQLIRILEDLSSQLGTKNYFFGDRCSSLDAIVGGQLLFLFYSDLPVNYAKDIKDSRFRNLKDFAFRMVSYQDLSDGPDPFPQPREMHRCDSGFLRDAFFDSPPQTVDQLWRAQRTQLVADSAVTITPETQEEFWDERKKSWLFVSGSIGAVVFYLVWYKNIRGIKIELR